MISKKPRVLAGLLALLLVAGLAWAHLYRYEVVGRNGAAVFVWDRWQHRSCVYLPDARVRCSDGTSRDADLTARGQQVVDSLTRVLMKPDSLVEE